MELKQLATVITELRDKYELDVMDILILDAINDLCKEQGSVLTMQLIRSFNDASHVTTHVRMKKLIAMGLLERLDDPTNLRIKKVVLTYKAFQLFDFIKEF